MRIAVLEAVCAGLCGDDPPSSLLAEGKAMWHAVIDDLLAIPDVTVDTLADERWFPGTPTSPRFHCWNVNGFVEATLCWESSFEDADVTWIIAPESEGLLERLVTTASTQTRSWNASTDAIRLCTDKLRLAEHLLDHGLNVIPTELETWKTPPSFEGQSQVIKPRDGAGSHLVRRIDAETDWRCVRTEFQSAEPQPQAIRQPFLNGQPLSIAGWFGEHGVTWFPVAEQHLSGDGCFAYQGGAIPADMDVASRAAVQELASQAAATIPGLRGYIGFDVLLPTESPLRPVLVEVNPRLTTSMIGMRRLCGGAWLNVASGQPLRWHTDRRIHFTAAGKVREEKLP